MISTHKEVYYTGETSRFLYDSLSEEAVTIINKVKEAFPWSESSGAFAISSPVTHEVLNEPVVTFILTHQVTKLLLNRSYPLSARKFCMDSKTSYLKSYFIWQEEQPSYLPESCTALFKSENLAEYNRPTPSNFNSFYDCYFKGDPSTVEAHFNLPKKRGKYDTFYGLTVDNGEVCRVKQYVYDSATKFSDWEVGHLAFTKILENFKRETL